MGISLTLASNKASQSNQSTLFRTTQDEGISSRRCSGCHSLCFRCALEGRQEVLGRPLEGWPVGDGKKRISIGCMMGPYETGIVSNGQDTGAGFTVKQIEDNPSAFFTDVHSSLAVP